MRSRVIKNACDCHCHIIDARFPNAGDVPAGMTLDDYLLFQQKIGVERAVFVQAKLHGTDHSCLVDALRRMAGKARGIAVVHPDITIEALKQLDEAGVRGIRFSLWNPHNAVVTAEMIAPLAAKIAPLGWHVQLHMTGDQIFEHKDSLETLPCPIVFDHMARIPPEHGIKHPAFEFVCGLVVKKRAWVKLSGPYMSSSRFESRFADMLDIARGFVARIPQALVWGSDWPHATETKKPDSSMLLALRDEWGIVGPLYEQIMIAAPKALYGFE